MVSDARDLLRPLRPNHWQITPYKHFLITLVRKKKKPIPIYALNMQHTHQAIHLLTAQH